MKKKFRQKKARNKSLLEKESVLLVAQDSAALSEGILALARANPNAYKKLVEANGDVAGVWLLCARASAALEDEISNLPMLDDYYDEMIGNLAAALIGDPREWTNEAIKEKLSEIIDDVVVEIAQRPNLLAAAKGDLDQMLDDLE
jgi:hypothetical protein